jgi:integrase
MPKAHLKLVTPAIVKRTVVPRRPPNANLRTREHLTEAEVERLMNAARKNRWGHRDATMVLVAYRHGFRPAELVDLRWDQIDFTSGALHVRRVKRGTPSTHPILGDELRALRRLQREQDPKSPFVFTSERGAPFSTAGFARMIARAGAEARLGFKAHPHMLRHACGFARSPTRGTTPEPCRLTWAIGISNTRCATRNCRQHGFGISGESESVPGFVRKLTSPRVAISTRAFPSRVKVTVDALDDRRALRSTEERTLNRH